jgi:hypothetical protein
MKVICDDAIMIIKYKEGRGSLRRRIEKRLLRWKKFKGERQTQRGERDI